MRCASLQSLFFLSFRKYVKESISMKSVKAFQGALTLKSVQKDIPKHAEGLSQKINADSKRSVLITTLSAILIRLIQY